MSLPGWIARTPAKRRGRVARGQGRRASAARRARALTARGAAPACPRPSSARLRRRGWHGGEAAGDIPSARGRTAWRGGLRLTRRRRPWRHGRPAEPRGSGGVRVRGRGRGRARLAVDRQGAGVGARRRRRRAGTSTSCTERVASCGSVTRNTTPPASARAHAGHDGGVAAVWPRAWRGCGKRVRFPGGKTDDDGGRRSALRSCGAEDRGEECRRAATAPRVAAPSGAAVSRPFDAARPSPRRGPADVTGRFGHPGDAGSVGHGRAGRQRAATLPDRGSAVARCGRAVW